MESRRFQEVEGPKDVGLEVKFGMPDGGAHTSSCGQVNDCIGAMLGNDRRDGIGIPNIRLMEDDVREGGAKVGVFEGGGVEIVEVVENGDFMARAESMFHKVGPDKPGASRDEQLHLNRLTAAKIAQQGRTRNLVSGFLRRLFLEAV